MPSNLGVTFISLPPCHPNPLPWTSGHSLYFFLLCHELPPLPNLLPLPEFVWLSCLQQIESEKEEFLGGSQGLWSRREEGRGTRQYLTGSDSLQIIQSLLLPCPPSKNTWNTHTHTHTHTNFPVREQYYLRRLFCEVRNSGRSKYL